MTALFDGMAGLLNDTFGGSVLHTPAGGVAVSIQARFRRKPIEVFDEDGSASLLMSPTLRVPEPVASTVAAGDLVAPEGGVTYRIKNRQPSGSPASDAFVIFELTKEPSDG